MGVATMDRIRDEDISGTEQWKKAGGKFRETRLRRFGHEEEEGEYIAGGPEGEQRGGLWLPCTEDVDLDGVREEDAEN